ncbi:MAG: hypothetical protein R3B70_22525 [Polyangiaceae bacterium]
MDAVVRRFFLFTVVGVVISGERVRVFAVGDGVVGVNGEVWSLGPFPDNAPPYPGHALLRGGPAEAPGFEVLREMAVGEVESIVVATDGASEWGDVQGRFLPGTEERVGALAQVWEEDRYFAHPDALWRKLARMNRARVLPAWESRVLRREPGLLEDDTTLVVIRKKRCGGESAGAEYRRAG